MKKKLKKRRLEKSSEKEELSYAPEADLESEKDDESEKYPISALDTFPTKAALGLYLRHIKHEDT